jgi:hypothetical protein
MADRYIGNPTWAEQGFVSPEDEDRMHWQYVQNNIAMVGLRYAYDVCFSNDPYKGDEVYGGDAFQYIPTEVEVGAAIAMRNMSTAGEAPIQTNDPGMTQLVQGIYQNMARFWQDIRNASGTGW